jgi:phosphatidylinositol 3-kinase
MKLNKEMIDAMGGADSDQYRKFRTLACEAYNILRKSASLLVSLFHLMAGASIPDVQSDPEKAMLKLQVPPPPPRPTYTHTPTHPVVESTFWLGE